MPSVPSAPTGLVSAPSAGTAGSIKAGDVLTGKVSWTSASGPCDFLIDGVVKWHENYAPYVFNGDGQTLDTATLTDGSHTFAVKTSSGLSSVTATVKNTIAPPADPVQAKIDAVKVANPLIADAIQAVYDYLKVRLP